MMKKAIWIIFFILMPSIAFSYLAKVNDELIEVEDFKDALSSFHSYIQMRQKKAGRLTEKNLKDALDNLINHYLLAQEAKRLGLDKEPDYLKGLDYYRRRLATRALWNEEIKKIDTSDERLRAYYKDKETKWHVRQIFTKERKKAEEALRRLKAGEDFSKVAREFSEGPYASRGGDLGFIKRGKMVKGWEGVAFSLRPGQFSDIIETYAGFHIIKLEEIKLPDMEMFEEKKKFLKRRFLKEKKREIESALKLSLRKKAKIEINKKLLKEIRPEGSPSGVIAWVNNEPIFVKDFFPIFKRRTWGYKAMQERWHIDIDLEKIKNGILQELIDRYLIEQEALRRGYFKKDKKLKRELAKYKRELLVDQFRRKIIAPQITLTERELKGYYEKHKEDYLSPNRYNLRLIRVNSKEEAMSIREELLLGADFALLARKKSISDSAKSGGALGWVPEDRLPTKIKEAVSKLKPGQISPIIEDGPHYSILLLQGEKRGSPFPFEKVKERIKRDLWNQKFNEFLNTYLKKLKKFSRIKIDKSTLKSVERDFNIREAK